MYDYDLWRGSLKMDILLDLQFCYKVFNGAQDGLFILEGI